MNRATLRCAIYTRVSSDQGLEQDFNSLDAQREAAEAYIKSQAHEGWKLHREPYDDGGFSGGSMDRPAPKKLLAALANGRIDVIVVYKVDRLTRSLADFAKLVEIFDANKVSFVSVTQSFNTTSSMGRLTLNVLLSFAQFEREVTGERIRDKIAASKKKGMWMGGVVPLGYRVENRKLLIEKIDAETVRFIFQRYLKLGSLPALQRDLRERGIVSRTRTLATGKTVGGGALSNGALSHLLKNRMYLGEINHGSLSYPAEHLPIVSFDLFEAVQAKLAENLNHYNVSRGDSNALLKGRIYDAEGHLMSPSHTTKKGILYRYYISSTLVQGQNRSRSGLVRLPAPEIEAIVTKAVGSIWTDHAQQTSMAPIERAEMIALRVDVVPEALEITWTIPNERPTIMFGPRVHAYDDDQHEEGADQHRCRAVVPYLPQPHKRRRDTIVPVDASGSLERLRPNEHRHLLASIATGKAWLREIIASGIDCCSIATRERRSERSVRMILSLAFLDPRLVRAAIHGNLPRGYGAKRLVDLPAAWAHQWQTLGLTPPH